MSSRVKFLSLIFMILGGFATVLILFMKTDYARNEMVYFREYPYRELSSRQVIYVEEKILSSLSMTEKENILPKNRGTSRQLKPAIPVVASIIQSTGATIDAPPGKTERRLIKKIHRPIKSAPPLKPQQIIPNKPSEKRPKLKKTIPKNWRQDAGLGYEAYERGDYKKAILYFERALELSADHQDIRLQLAYAHKILGQNAEAIKNFSKVIDHYGSARAPFTLRREVEQLKNRFEVNGYVIYRDESSTTRQLGADLTQSQAGVEVSYQPKDIGLDKGRKFQIYARLLSAMEQDQLRLDTNSYQAGFGLRLKPLPNHNLVLSAERLVKVGTFSRNDWMLRAGYSRDHGTDYREDKTKWWSYSLYLDAALIDPADPDIFLTSQFTGGYNMTIAEGLVLQPRLTALATWQKDSFRTSSLIEAGPGINIRTYFNDTYYEAYRSYIDFNIEYRIKISGNSIGGSGPIVSLLLHF